MDGVINDAISLSQTEQGQGRNCRGANAMLAPSASLQMSFTLLFESLITKYVVLKCVAQTLTNSAPLMFKEIRR